MDSNNNFRYEHPCEQCGSPVRAYYKSQLRRFCCAACSNQWKWDNLGRKRVEYITVKCSFCGKEKSVQKTDHRVIVGQSQWFCDHNCEREYRYLKRTTIVCPICGKCFPAQNLHGKKTCSMECGRKSQAVAMFNRIHGTTYSWSDYARNKENNTLKKCQYQRTNVGVYAGREKEYLKEYSRRPENRARAKDRREKRMAEDPVYAFKISIRKKISSYVRNRRVKKDIHTEQILGCSLEQFMIHLESQFKRGMSWSNYGKWEIDHIIPLSTAKTKEDVYRLNHYSNMRPLWKKENWDKRDKIIQIQLKLPIDLQ